jgi:hypothetical protein
VKEPTKEQMRVAIAEACGWTWGPGYCRWHGPTMTEANVLPDYLTDLDAMHGAEKVLTYEQQPIYLHHLKRVLIKASDIGAAGEFEQTCATAHQRALAFCRVVRPDLFQ